ncbi:MAG: NTP transferase domain-containing protein, partial [Pirellulaceae bacterium]|nr:NTP transferase domain-containing protein [Pirellulaceae bacterium]
MPESKPLVEDTIVVILAAGKGTRMGRDDLVKVCFEIDGVPAINRAISAFKKNRFRRFLLVVGDKAQQVLDAVNAEHPGVMYAYQNPQLGTGHAGRIAAESLQNMGYEGHVFVSMGDKYIEEVAIETLVDGFVKQQPDMALLTLPKPKSGDAPGGRVLLDDQGQALGIIEQADLAKQALVDDLTERVARRGSLTGRQMLDVVARHIRKPDKQARAVPELLKLAEQRETIDEATLLDLFERSRYHLEIDGCRRPAREIERMCTGLNPSLYLFRAEAFYAGMNMLRNDNAQGEYYITDVIRLLGSVRDESGEARYRVRSVPAAETTWVQGFNSPDELLAIADYARRKKLGRTRTAAPDLRPHLKPNQFATVRQWLDKIEANKPSLGRWLSRIYGEHEPLHRTKAKDLADVLSCHGKKFGFDERVCLVRAPGRINLMGRHVDHRGGSTNFLAIDRETIAVAGLRDDNNVVAVSTQPRRFKPVRFNISELIGRFAWSDWVNFVNSDWDRNLLYGAPGDWGNYIKAAMLRLQHQY